MLVLLFLAHFMTPVDVQSLPVQLTLLDDGLNFTAYNSSVPTITWYKPTDQQATYGSYQFMFLGLEEADSSLNLVNGSRWLAPTGWSLSGPVPTTQGRKIGFSYPPAGQSPPGMAFQGMNIVLETFDNSNVPVPTQTSNPINLGLTFFIDTYKWVGSDLNGYLILYFQLSSSLNMTANILRPDKVQVKYGFLQSPQFAQGYLFNGSVLERVPVTFHASSPTESNYTYWILYEHFDENLLHPCFIGYGVEQRPNLATITLLSCFGVVVLSCVIVGLVVFGHKLDKRYGKKFEAIGQ